VKVKFTVTDTQQVVSICILGIDPDSLLECINNLSVKAEFTVTDPQVVVGGFIISIKPDGLLE